MRESIIRDTYDMKFVSHPYNIHICTYNVDNIDDIYNVGQAM